MSERSEVAHLSDQELLDAVAEAREQVRLARLRYEQAVTDAMIRTSIRQPLVAEAAGVTRRALFDITNREADRRQQSGE